MLGTTVFDMKRQYATDKPIAEWKGWKIYAQPTDGIFFGVDVAEGKEKGDFTTVC